jgi:hypothetical protein
MVGERRSVLSLFCASRESCRVALNFVLSIMLLIMDHWFVWSWRVGEEENSAAEGSREEYEEGIGREGSAFLLSVDPMSLFSVRN